MHLMFFKELIRLLYHLLGLLQIPEKEHIKCLDLGHCSKITSQFYIFVMMVGSTAINLDQGSGTCGSFIRLMQLFSFKEKY